MEISVRRLVRSRAGNVCEYCGVREIDTSFGVLQIEHIIALKHHGSDSPDNLALACVDCNLCKGTNIAGIDLDTGQLTRLFNPRVDDWSDHFEVLDCHIVGKTPIGRTTVDVLNMNSADQLHLRRMLGRGI